MKSAWKQFVGVGALALVFSLGAPDLHAAGSPALQGYGQGPYGRPGPGGPGGPGGWDAPPQELRDAARQGYSDGIQGARRDVENHRPPNVNNRDEYRHPNVPGNVRRDYRNGFRRGYNVAMQHLINGGGRY